jgi:hypothetical protein
MPDATALEFIEIAGLFTGVCFAMIFMLSFILQFIVALKARPARRALWSVAPPVVLVALAFGIWGPHEDGMQLWLPLAAIPAGLLAFGFWYFSFRRAWVNDPDNLPEGASLSNDDWKIGLAVVVAVLATNVLRNLFLHSF